VTAELWQLRHPDGPSVHQSSWPGVEQSLLVVETETLVVQVDGKVRDRIEVAADVSEDDAVALALASSPVASALSGRVPRRVVARPPRLVNLVT
jgi:leucyl-tRNA synthetase